jgi:hypothetical protein
MQAEASAAIGPRVQQPTSLFGALLPPRVVAMSIIRRVAILHSCRIDEMPLFSTDCRANVSAYIFGTSAQHGPLH